MYIPDCAWHTSAAAQESLPDPNALPQEGCLLICKGAFEAALRRECDGGLLHGVRAASAGDLVHRADELEAQTRLTTRRTGMSKLREWLAREARMRAQHRELARLRAEVASLRTQNERMKTAMRRCLTCEFRLQVVGRS